MTCRALQSMSLKKSGASMICGWQAERWFAEQYEIESLTKFWSNFSEQMMRNPMRHRTSGLYRAKRNWLLPASVGRIHFNIEENFVIQLFEISELSFSHAAKVETFSGSESQFATRSARLCTRHYSKKLAPCATIGEGLNLPEIQYRLCPDLLRVSSTENFLKVDRLALFAQIVDFQRRGRGHVYAISGETLRRGLGVSSDYSNQSRTWYLVG